MNNKSCKRILFLFSSVVLILFFSVLYVQYGVGMHSDCPKCDSAVKDLRQLSDKLYLLRLNKRYFDSLEDFNEELEGAGSPMVDPWGNKYLYSTFMKNKHQCFVVWSFGSNGIPGGYEKHELDMFRFGPCK